MSETLSNGRPSRKQSGSSSGRPPNAGAQSSWVVAALGNVVQAVTAVLQFSDSLKTLVFATALGLSTYLVFAHYNNKGRLAPNFFAGGILLAIVIFVFTTPSTREQIAASANSAQSIKSGKNASSSDGLSGGHLVAVLTFLDVDGDGVQAANEHPLPGVTIKLSDGEPDGMARSDPNLTGKINPVRIHGARVVVNVCGISQSHKIESDHRSAVSVLDIAVGVSELVRAACIGSD